MNENIKNEQESVVSLSLKKNIKTIIIDGQRFEMNLDDPEVYKALCEFKETHNEHPANLQNDIDGLLEHCERVIDTCLGKGTCERLFREPDMKMYLLVNELANVYLENFMKEEREEAEARNRKELEGLKAIIKGMTEVTKMMKYADNKYGNRNRDMNNYVRSKNSSRKNKNRVN